MSFIEMWTSVKWFEPRAQGHIIVFTTPARYLFIARKIAGIHLCKLSNFLQEVEKNLWGVPGQQFYPRFFAEVLLFGDGIYVSTA